MAGYTNGYNPTNAGYGRYAPNSMYANNQNFSPTPYSNNYLNNFQSPYNNYLNNGIQATQQPLQISTTYVTSVEEARAQQVNLDGSRQLFIDTSTGKIYSKQFNFSTGAADFEIFSKEGETPEQEKPKTEMEIVQETVTLLANEVSRLKEMFINVQSPDVTANDGFTKSTNSTNDAASTTNAASRAKPKRNNKSIVAAESE